MFSDLALVNKLLQQSLLDVKKEVNRKIRLAIDLVHDGVTSRTPVWSGELLRNWVWSEDQVASQALIGPVSTDRGSYGHTSTMSLGDEPMRGASMDTIDASRGHLNTEDLTKFHKYILSNAHPHAEMAEFGALPSTDRSRSPGGMIRVTEQELIVALGAV